LGEHGIFAVVCSKKSGSLTRTMKDKTEDTGKIAGEEFVVLDGEEDSGEIVIVSGGRRATLWETVAFALLCVVAAGAAWYLWTHTEHRPALPETRVAT
jgi:hypothetical protein